MLMRYICGVSLFCVVVLFFFFFFFSFFFFLFFVLFSDIVYKSICCGYSFELWM